MTDQTSTECPILSTHDKYHEARYFFSRLLRSYHQPREFQYNLNAFIQALRNITFMMQSEEKTPEGFEEWYEQKQREMRANELLRRFVLARNIIVKRSSLTAKSKAASGLFRGRSLKLAIVHDLPPFEDTKEALDMAKKLLVGFMVRSDHGDIGEQLGVERTWVVDELGDEEVIGLCLYALNYFGTLVAELHRMHGLTEEEHEEIKVDMSEIQVLLETDLDPTLAKKWGWED